MILNPLWRLLAGGAIILAVVGVIYGKGRLDQAHKADMAALRAELTAEREIRERHQIASAKYAEAYTRSQARLTEFNKLNMELESYVETLESADRVCLDPADTGQLRKLWQ